MIKYPVLPSPSEEQHLHKAIIRGDLDEVQRIATERPLLLKERDRNGHYPIHLALLAGHASIVDFLVEMERRSLAYYIDARGFGVIHHAAFARYTNLVIRLIEEFGLSITDGPDHETAFRLLNMVARSGNIRLLRYLLDEMPERGGMTRPKLTDRDLGGNTLLYHSILQDRLEVFLYLVEHYPTLLEELDEEKIPPFWTAVRCGATRIVAHMIEHKMHRGYPETWPPVTDDVKQRQSHDDHFDLVLQSAMSGSIDLLRWLRDHDYSLETPRDENGATALHAAAECGHLEVVKFLLSETALDPYGLDMFGWTPISKTCADGHLEVAQYLHGLRSTEPLDPVVPQQLHNPNLKHGSLLRKASRYGHLGVCQWLVTSRICDVNHQDADGYTALMVASRFGHLNIVEWLLSEGADPKIINSSSKIDSTAFWMAVNDGHLDVLKLLHAQDASVLWDPNPARPQDNPLSLAFYRGHIDVCNWLVSVDDHTGELERWNGRGTFEWSNDGLGSLQPIWNWEKRVGAGRSKQSGIMKQKNPLILKTLLDILESCTDNNNNNILSSLRWLVSLGISMDDRITYIDVEGQEGSTSPLESALFEKNLVAVKFLVETAQVSLLPLKMNPTGDSSDWMILDIPVDEHQPEIFEYLADKVRERHPEFDFDSVRQNFTLLGRAARGGTPTLEIFRLLIDKYKATRCLFSTWPAWSLIACGGSVDMWKFAALKLPGDFSKQVPDAHTVQCALTQGNVEMMIFLLDELRLPLDGVDMVRSIANAGLNTQMIKCLYERGVSMKMMVHGTDYYSSILNEAVLKDKIDLVKWLISIGLSVNMQAQNGRTPLLCACENGNIEIVKWLLAHGASMRAPINGEGVPFRYRELEAYRSAITLIHGIYNS
jgi:ankyrin repeat protein